MIRRHLYEASLRGIAFTTLLNTYLRTRDYFEVQPQLLEFRKRIDDIESRRQSGRRDSESRVPVSHENSDVSPKPKLSIATT